MYALFDRYAPWILGVSSLFLIAGAWIGQTGFDLYPCILCLAQRKGHYVAIAAAIAAGLTWNKGRLWILPFLILVIGQLHSAGYAGYHAGVEQKWWEGTQACAGTLVATDSVEARLQQLQQGGAAKCDEIPWDLFGISLAGYNFLFSALLGIAGIYVFWRRRHDITGQGKKAEA